MADYRIRLLTTEDAAAFRSLRLSALEVSPASFGSSLAEESARPLVWFERTVAEDRIAGAFSAEGALLGTVAVKRQAGEKHAHKGMVWGVFVSETARGSGLGRTLIDHAIAECRGWVDELRLSVSATNKAAHQLYLAAGFEQYGFEPRALRVGAEFVDERLMWRSVLS